MNIRQAYIETKSAKKKNVLYAFHNGVMSQEVFQVNNLNSYESIITDSISTYDWSQYYNTGENVWIHQSNATVWQITDDVLKKPYAYNYSGSLMIIPTIALTDYSTIKVICRMTQKAGTVYDYLYIYAYSIVNNVKNVVYTEAIRDTDWVDIELDISSLEHLDYIGILGCDGVGEIKEIVLL